MSQRRHRRPAQRPRLSAAPCPGCIHFCFRHERCLLCNELKLKTSSTLRLCGLTQCEPRFCSSEAIADFGFRLSPSLRRFLLQARFAPRVLALLCHGQPSLRSPPAAFLPVRFSLLYCLVLSLRVSHLAGSSTMGSVPTLRAPGPVCFRVAIVSFL